uniref:Putative LOC100692109 [Oreochromis niloticus] n=1 Tax=Lepeophtheirus salmonis TaxID=72036 RepID=A0A0K2U1T6_LEPSM
MLRSKALYCYGSFRYHSIRVGCASGFWGDTPTAPRQFFKGAEKEVDYVVYDYLSELTMSLLSAAKMKNPALGYAPDFVSAGIGPYLSDIKEKGIKVITNAGGINTEACAKSIREACKETGVDLKIATVSGDNLLGRKDIQFNGVREMFSNESLPSKITSMTAYFGAGPIVTALDQGADIVITGRTADSALALAPFIHSFDWKDWDRLALGSLAGHLIECGGQATGGLFTDWFNVPSYENLGFPIVSADKSGQSLFLTKPKGTGGIINPATVSEQMLYEIGDPTNYVLPDVICDFSQVSIESVKDGVRISGALGKPPTSTYKVCATYLDGYKGTVACLVSGGDSKAKGRKTADSIMNRTSMILKKSGLSPFERTHVQVLGSSEDAMIWLSVHHSDKKAIALWSREIASAGTGMTPGLTSMIGGRPKAVPLLRLFSFLYPKSLLPGEIKVNEDIFTHIPDTSEHCDVISEGQREDSTEDFTLASGSHTHDLEDLVFARSGDKGNSCNIGLIARHPAFLPYIRKFVTEKVVKDYFRDFIDDDMSDDSVIRYDVPGIHGFNFLLKNSLGGGGMASLRSDPLGKSYAQKLLSLKITNLPSLEEIRSSYINIEK